MSHHSMSRFYHVIFLPFHAGSQKNLNFMLHSHDTVFVEDQASSHTSYLQKPTIMAVISYTGAFSCYDQSNICCGKLLSEALLAQIYYL